MNDMPKHDDDPRAPHKVYEGEELKGTYPTALKHGGRNSNSKARQNRNVIYHQGRSGARRYMTARLDLTLPTLFNNPRFLQRVLRLRPAAAGCPVHGDGCLERVEGLGEAGRDALISLG